MDTTPYTTGRRRILQLIGAGSIGGIAGCLDTDSAEADEPRDEDESETPDPADSEAAPETGETAAADLREPVTVPADRTCAVCNMVPAEYPDWNAQLVHEQGDREFFCSSGCMAAYIADPPRFEGPDTAVETIWVTGFETGELHEATAVVFVRVTDSEHVDDIMGRNPVPFAEREDADAFLTDFDAYDESDLLTIDDFDRDLAEFYRSRFFAEEDNGEMEHEH